LPAAPERPIENEPERLLESYLDACAAGEKPDLDALARTLTDPRARAQFRGTALAQEYLAQAAEGAAADDLLSELMARLADAEERRAFDEVLEDERRARGCLPGELVPGALLEDRFEIRRELGRGMDVVYVAFDLSLQREVAIKVLRAPVRGSAPGWEELFVRESRTLARLESRNIVAIHDARRGPDRSYIVMDLVRGASLHQVLESVRADCPAGPPRDPAALRQAIGRAGEGERDDLLRGRTHARCVAAIVQRVAQTLEHAHGVGVIHRDLKPQNLMVLPGGEPVLLDFGLASWEQDGPEHGLWGTPEYMAPEQIERLRAGKDPRTDVYQVGLILYELLTLQRAFGRRKGEELWSVLERIQSGRVRPLREVAPNVPPALAAIVARAMARDPEQRTPTMAALREDLERYLIGLPPRHATLPPLERLGLRLSYVARRPATALSGALLLAGILWMHDTPWIPPELGVLQIERGTLSRLDENQPILVDDTALLGLDVASVAPAWLYVFQVFGSGADRAEQYVRPVCPVDLVDYATLASLPEPGPIRVEAGEQRLVCAELPDPQPFEGLLVCAAPSELEVLAEWQRTLTELEAMEGLPVPYLEAQRHLEQLRESVRGEQLGTLDAEQRRAIVGDLAEALQGAPTENRSPDWRLYVSVHPVRSTAPGEAR
jgi:serine/threonine protein kinase